MPDSKENLAPTAPPPGSYDSPDDAGKHTGPRIIDLDTARIKLSAESHFRKNNDSRYDKPREDFHICDAENRIFILMDGATRYVPSGEAYPSPSPAASAARIFAQTAHENLLHSKLNREEARSSLCTAISRANIAVRDFNRTNFNARDHLKNDYANACGIVCLIQNSSFYYSYIADPQGHLIRDGQAEAFTHIQTEYIDNIEKTSRADPAFDIAKFRQTVCCEIRNNKNHPHGFGSFTGEESALDLLESGEIKLWPGDRILLASDGLLPVFKHRPAIILSEDYDLYFSETEAIEQQLSLRSDDKTLIALKIF